MVADVTAQSAKLAQHHGAVGIVEEDVWRTVVVVQVHDVAHALIVVATAGSVHQAGGVYRAGEVDHLGGLELPPALVEGSPHHHRRTVVVLLHDFLPLVLEGSLHGAGLLARDGAPLSRHPRLVAASQCGHVLPHKYAQTVAVVVPAGGFHLHVLANHVVAQLLRLLHVVGQRLVGGCCVESVGPVALVEQSEVEHVAVVQLHAPLAIVQLAGRNLAHGGVCLHVVATLQRHLEVVEPRVGGAPQLGVGHAQLDGAAHGAVGLCHDVALQLHHHAHRLVVGGIAAYHGDAQLTLVDVGGS